MVSELLVRIFYLHSLWLSLSRLYLLSGIFFLPLFALKAPSCSNIHFHFLFECVLSHVQIPWLWSQPRKWLDGEVNHGPHSCVSPILLLNQ